FSSPATGSTEISSVLGPAVPPLNTRVSGCNCPFSLNVMSWETSTLPLSRTVSLLFAPESPQLCSVTVAVSLESGRARAGTTASVISTSLSGCSLPKPMVWMGMRCRRMVNRHAARIVHQNRHHVLLGTQRGDAQRGVPEQKEDERDQAAFQQPDDQRARAGKHAVIAAHVPEKGACNGQNGNRQRPDRPRRQENELALMENAGRVFEQEFEH